jgi:hypothetical protein
MDPHPKNLPSEGVGDIGLVLALVVIRVAPAIDRTHAVGKLPRDL